MKSQKQIKQSEAMKKEWAERKANRSRETQEQVGQAFESRSSKGVNPFPTQIHDMDKHEQEILNSQEHHLPKSSPVGNSPHKYAPDKVGGNTGEGTLSLHTLKEQSVDNTPDAKDLVYKSLGIPDEVTQKLPSGVQTQTNLYDMKLGEETNNNKILMDILEAPAKLVKITYTLQDKEGTQMSASLIHKDYEEPEDDGKCNARIEQGDEEDDI
jgi:hypothetical protein